MNLYERYRPQTFEQVIGQDKAIRQIRLAGKTGFGGKAFWVSGPSGAGKTTLARIIASEIASEFAIQEFDSADSLSMAALDEIDRTMHMFGWGAKSGRAFIVNESHGLRKPIIRRLLGMLERIPSHVVWVFTTTKEAMTLFEDDQLDASPLLSRCVQVTLTNQGLSKVFAEHVQTIARTEGLDGKPISAYLQLARDCRNNCRMMLQQVESGAMAD
jgi:replication-associated recombination protein RarA